MIFNERTNHNGVSELSIRIKVENGLKSLTSDSYNLSQKSKTKLFSQVKEKQTQNEPL